MKVFVTGASGYIGSSAVESLVCDGHQVFGLARSEASAAAIARLGAEPVLATLDDLPKLASEARAADGVIHAAFDSSAFNVGDFVKMTDSFELDRIAVTTMLEALEGTGKPFIYTSGASALGYHGKTPADETSIPSPEPWMQPRANLERHVLDAAGRGVRSCVLRPALVYGRGGNILVNFMIAIARDAGVGRTIGDGSNKWSFIHVDDLGDLYALAIEKAPPGSVLHGAVGDPVAMRDVAAAIGRALGLGDRVEPWPVDEARESFGLADSVAAELQLSSARTAALVGWKPGRPTIIEELENGSYDLTPAAKIVHHAE